jgi:hypothetical protein
VEVRFNMPQFTPAGLERIRLAMERGHRGDDPVLPIRRIALRKSGGDYISWSGPVDYGCPEEMLWEMEIDVEQFQDPKGRRAFRDVA